MWGPALPSWVEPLSRWVTVVETCFRVNSGGGGKFSRPRGNRICTDCSFSCFTVWLMDLKNTTTRLTREKKYGRKLLEERCFLSRSKNLSPLRHSIDTEKMSLSL
ncbi:unnamed protein product [Amoebophrya sp. A25]|nr:unnamed protein product [Amoebophrya sp. A25]|eukprot:GSA25T00013491001.1